jgi:Lrp/AsnC family transcriptional regulator for asnA, asnC and gidA
MSEKDRISIDDVDKKIILELQKDGRTSYKTIAKKLQVSDGTVRLRIDKMIKNNVLRISASVNPFFFVNRIMAIVGMKLEKRTHSEVMEKLSQLGPVKSVCNVTGRYDIFAEVFLNSREELNKFLIEDISQIDGIQSTETYVYLDALKKWVELSQDML